MSAHGTSSVLEKLSSGVASTPVHSRRKKSIVVALAALLLLVLPIALLKSRERGNISEIRRDAEPQDVFRAKKLACEEGLKEGKFSFWLRYMRSNDVVCQMYAEAYAEMKGEVGHGVPKIIHQSWKAVEVKEDFLVWSSSWKNANPEHEYWFWTDEDNRDLVKAYYPQFLKTYDEFPANINRADFARALYMHKYGGVYADMDTWCLQPVDTLFSPGSRKAYVAEMGSETSFTQNIPNAWFGSAPNHPFWIFFSKCAVELLSVLQTSGEWTQIEQVSGPLLLKQAVDAWNGIHGEHGDPTLEIIKHGRVYVEDWHLEDSKNQRLWDACPSSKLYRKEVEQECRAAFPDAVVLTFWTHTWR